MSTDATSPVERSRRGPALVRPRFRTSHRIALLALLLVALWALAPKPVSTEALAAAEGYLQERFPGYPLTPPRTQTTVPYTLVYVTDYAGRRAKIVLTLSRQEGQLQVVDGTLIIGGEPERYLIWGAEFAVVVAVICLVFFVSVPRMFGRKCPRDGSLLRVAERVAVRSRVHKSGFALAPIIQRRFDCPQCDFHHLEVFQDFMASAPPSPSSAWKADWLLPGWERLSEKSRERRLRNAITDEEYRDLLTRAKEEARENSSRDSPWLESVRD